MTPKLLLIILDGFGIREATQYNAIANASAPTWQHLWATQPHVLLDASGPAVGLPLGQMGNSEVGHLTIGSGRVIHQDLSRIDQAIASGALQNNRVLQDALALAKTQKRAIHFLGLLSEGGVHSHQQHLYALLQQCHTMQLTQVYIHAFLDGRDVPPQSAATAITDLEQHLQTLGCGQIASICGRYYAMDRDQRWQRTQSAYELLTEGQADYQANNALDALHAAYARGETDEFVKPTTVTPAVVIADGDIVVFWNYRSDRARQLSHALLQPEFSGFIRQKTLQLGAFLSFTRYAEDIDSQVIFPPQDIRHTLGDCLAQHGLTQLRMAETEKYAHVTFFFNGGREAVLPGEQRLLVASPKVDTYDLQPEMSAPELSQQLIQHLSSQQFDVIVCNYANPDMVGHTGNYEATQHSIEILDRCLTQVLQAAEQAHYEVIITADHGNAECMYDEIQHQPHTAHTLEPVPLVYIGRKVTCLRSHGTLADVAPTVLHLLQLPIPAEMTGQILLTPDHD